MRDLEAIDEQRVWKADRRLNPNSAAATTALIRIDTLLEERSNVLLEMQRSTPSPVNAGMVQAEGSVMATTNKRYYWDRKIWGEIPGLAFHIPVPQQPARIHTGHLPISNQTCPACHTPMAQALIDDGETHHITCYPANTHLQVVQ